MKEYFDLLGYEVHDRITGYTGVADSICFDLYGCVQVSVIPPFDKKKDKERKPGSWFDFKRLERLSRKPVLTPPAFEFAEPATVAPGRENGPADKAGRF